VRKLQALLGLLVLTSVTGCPPDGSRFNLLRPSSTNPTPPTEPPSKDALVAYLNNNSANIPGIISKDVSLTYYLNPIGSIPLNDCKLGAQGPRNFRLVANWNGGQEVDMGSNEQEFWYWIKKGEPPYQYFCSYQALEQGQVQYSMPFPFQPEWVLEAMGMGKYGSPEKYELAIDQKHQKFKLIEHTKSAQGTPVKKVIVFNSMRQIRDQDPQVTDFELRDEKTDKLICAAHITKRQILDKVSRAEIAREMELVWPAQNLRLGLQINNPQVTQQFPADIYVRKPLKNVPSFDLATGRKIDPVQQAGSWNQPAVTPR
jgi:hypothetical protein